MIFINYRKIDTQAVVDNLAKELKKHFGKDNVFKDDKDLRAGDRWSEALEEGLLKSKVLLAVIGKDWLTVPGDYGRRRIDQEDDWVRKEICTALEKKKKVIVLLVAPAVMPSKAGLPPGCLLQELPGLQSLPLRPGRDFDRDVDDLVEELKRILLPAPPPPPPSKPETPGAASVHSGCGVAPPPSEPLPNNLPQPPRGFIGHANLLAELREELRKGGVIIVKGQGGVGKTDLALAAAHAAYQDKELLGGMVWINGELKLTLESSLRQMAHIFFGDRLEHLDFERCGSQVWKHLHKCNPLVIFDYFEGLAGDKEILHWLAEIRTPARVIIITRNLPPGLQGHVIEVGVLPRAEAVQLFISRAQALGVKTANQERMIDQICAEVGDLPLAIQLLSARAVGVNLKVLLNRVREERLDAIAQVAADPNLPARHTSARACYTLSFEGLSVAARELLLRFSVFPDGAGDDLITAMVGNYQWVNAAEELVRVSMWRLDDSRYTVQTLIRQFAQEALGDKRSAAEAAAAQAMARLSVEKAKLTQPSSVPADMLDGLDWFAAEWRNLIACAAFAEAGKDWPTVCALADSIFDFWHTRGFWGDAERLYSQALAASQSANDRQGEAKFLNFCGKVYRHQGHWGKAKKAFLESGAIARAIGDRVTEGHTLYNLARIYQFQHKFKEAETAAQKSVKTLDKAGDRIDLARALFRLGVVYRHQDRLAEARQQYLQSLAICRELSDRIDEGSNLNNLARIDQIEGHFAEAERGYLGDLEICKQYRYRDGEGNVLKNLGSLYQQMGRLDEAEEKLHQSLAIRRELGDPVGQGETLVKLAELLHAQKKPEARDLMHQATAILRSTEDKHRLEQAEALLRKWESEPEA